MTSMAEAIERYLCTGEYEIDHFQWPGRNIVEKSKNGHDDHVRALVAEVKRRSKGRTHAPVPELDLAAWTRRKLTPMVHGFFPEAEREIVLRLFEKSVVFLTSDNIEAVLREQMWLGLGLGEPLPVERGRRSSRCRCSVSAWAQPRDYLLCLTDARVPGSHRLRTFTCEAPR